MSEGLKDQVREHWNRHPMDYDEVDALPGSKDFFRQVNSQFADVCYFGQKKGRPIMSDLVDYDSLKGKKVLIVGCGMGTVSTEFARHGAIVTAIDLTPTAVKNTKKQMKLQGVKGKVLVADAENLPFADGSFDFVWSWGVIHHTPDTAKAANEIHRVLRKGGKAFVMIYHKNSLFYYGHVVLFRGILQGRLSRMGARKLLNAYTDHSDKGGTPLAKCYSKREAQKLFSRFERVSTETYGVRNELYAVPFLRKYLYHLPDALPDFFLHTLGLGWYLCARLRK